MPEKLLTGEELSGIMQSKETSIRMCFTRRSLTEVSVWRGRRQIDFPKKSFDVITACPHQIISNALIHGGVQIGILDLLGDIGVIIHELAGPAFICAVGVSSGVHEFCHFSDALVAYLG